MQHERVVRPIRSVALLTALVALVATPAGARRQHAVCRDGAAPVVQRCVEGCPQPPIRCDVDRTCDGACTFVVQQCEGTACHDVNVPVPVGEKGLVMVSIDPPRFASLRCNRGLRCGARGCLSSADCPPCRTDGPIGCQCVEGRCQ